MKRLRSLRDQTAGDTIIEVLVVLSVLGLAFAISLATANHGLAQARNAEEHSHALGLLQTQIEQLRKAVTTQSDQSTIFQNSSPFCMTGATSADDGFNTGGTSGGGVSDPTSDNFKAYPSDCAVASDGGSYNYYESIVYVPQGNASYFELRVRWDGVGSLGRQQELMTYKINALTATASSGISLTGSSVQLVVGIKDVSRFVDSTTTPTSVAAACSSATPASDNHSNISVKLTGGAANSTKATDTSGTVAFGASDGVTDYGSYNVSVSPATLPSGWHLCPGNAGPTSVTLGDRTKEVDFSIYSDCNNSPYNVPAKYGYVGPAIDHGSTPPPATWPQPVAGYTQTSVYGPTEYWWAHTGGDELGGTAEHYYSEPTPLIYQQVNNPNDTNYSYIDPSTVPVGSLGYQLIAHDPSAKEPNWFMNVFTTQSGAPFLGYDYQYDTYEMTQAAYTQNDWSCSN